MKCPHCNNSTNNRTLNYCTICSKPHLDVLCGNSECAKRFSHEITEIDLSEEDEANKSVEAS